MDPSGIDGTTEGARESVLLPLARGPERASVVIASISSAGTSGPVSFASCNRNTREKTT
jgi:hypothetical protein